jgi:hypothetical protein
MVAVRIVAVVLGIFGAACIGISPLALIGGGTTPFLSGLTTGFGGIFAWAVLWALANMHDRLQDLKKP